MNAHSHFPEPAGAVTDAQLIALDAVAEAASILCGQSAALLAASAGCDVAETEARLWACRRALSVAIQSWREAVPANKIEGAKQ